MEREICNECGKSVKVGSGRFVNRIIDLNDFETKIEMGKPYATGEFICSDCDELINQLINMNKC
jgi:hypothetical protein